MKVSHQALKWSPQLATGVAKIDQQHQMLIGILNKANAVFAEGNDKAAQENVIEELISYAIYHFDTEEELMIDSGYGEACPRDEEDHIEAHRGFSEKARQCQISLQQGQSIDTRSLFEFLNNWLVNHVMGTDKKLAAYILNMQAS